MMLWSYQLLCVVLSLFVIKTSAQERNEQGSSTLCQQAECLNDGVCSVIENQEICICPEGFLGQRCEYESELNELHHRVRRVIGGTSYEEGKWPWLVSLQGKIPARTFLGIPLSYNRLYCGASLLNERWLLTAAHCIAEDRLGQIALTPKYWHAKVGELELQRSHTARIRDFIGKVLDIGGLRHYYLHATKIVIHPEYSKDRIWENDIALIKLEEDVPAGDVINPFIRSIRLVNANNMSFPEDGQDCIMKGWGCTANGGSVATTARQVTLPKVNDATCARTWGIQGTTRLCAGTTSAAELGLCSGDSGGPLACHNGVEWLQVGIASFTSAARPEHVPGVFTRVAQYVNWINEVIDSN